MSAENESNGTSTGKEYIEARGPARKAKDWAVRHIKGLSGAIEFRHCTKEQREQYRQSIRGDISALRAMLISFGRWLKGLPNSTRIVALFTVVLAVTTWLQWNTLRDQVRLAEGHLEEARKASRHTAGVIREMRLEKRPWLGVRSPIMQELIPNAEVDCVVPIQNTGDTPGFIDNALVKVFRLPADGDIANEVERIFQTAGDSPLRVVIPPQGQGSIIATVLTHLGEAEIAGIKARNWRLWVVGRFSYGDIDREAYFTEFYYYYDPSTRDRPDGEFVGYYKYQDMK